MNPDVENMDDWYNILSNPSLFFRASDSAVDLSRLVLEPTLEHANTLMRSITHLYNSFQGNNFYSTSFIITDIFAQIYYKNYEEAAVNALTAAAYAFLPIMIGSSLATEAINSYAWYRATENAYSFCVNYNTQESQLKSNLAYGELFALLGSKDMAKEFLVNAIEIEEDSPFIPFLKINYTNN